MVDNYLVQGCWTIFEIRGLRKILGLTTTYVNRQNTNEFVVRKANEELGHQPGTPLKIKLFSDLLIDRRIRLAGHILRNNDNDPLRRVSYEPNSAVTFDVGERRVGGPRQQWTQYSNKYAWENALGKGRYENTAQQNQELLNCARSRQFWKPIASAAACPRFHPYANTGMKPWLRKWFGSRMLNDIWNPGRPSEVPHSSPIQQAWGLSEPFCENEGPCTATLFRRTMYIILYRYSGVFLTLFKLCTSPRVGLWFKF